MAKKMDIATLKTIVMGERAAALGSIHASKLTNDRQDAMDYYNGDMTRVLPTEVGRSSAVSTDVSDTIEGLMPQLMDIFANSDDVVKFDATRADDEDAAEQESDYVNHVFLKNGGFLTLYAFIKDALLSKTGIVKVFCEESVIEKKATYLDQDDATYQYIVSDPTYEVIAHSERPDPGFVPNPQMPLPPGAKPPMLHDLVIVSKEKKQKARCEAVPPEEFGITRHARNIKDAGYVFHEVMRTEAQLLDQGYDEQQIKSLPDYPNYMQPEELSRDTVDESRVNGGDVSLNQANRPLMVTEHYIMLDYEGEGKPQLYRVTTGGEQGEILKRDGKEDIIEEDFMPFACMTPVIVTHRFYGKSIADLVMDIQRIKTSLMRALLDNAYLANNPRTEISESHASENTIDDLLVSRPGGVVRTKQPGGLNTLTTPPIGGHVFPLIEYMDSVREWRTGVTKTGQGLDANVLQNQSATVAVQAFNASQAKCKLIARIFAETGIKEMFALLHAVIRKHGFKAETVKLRGKWVEVDPRDWQERNDMTINVGLGSGGRSEELQNQTILMNYQKDALMNGLTNLVTVQNLFNSAKRLVRITGNKNVEEFFTDPSTQPPLQPKPDPKMAEIQAKAQIDQQTAASDAQRQDTKTKADIMIAQQKFELESELMKQAAAEKSEDHRMGIASALVKHATTPVKGVDGELHAPDPALLQQFTQHLTAPPKPSGMKIVRDEQGRASHTVPIEAPPAAGHPLAQHLATQKPRGMKIMRDEHGRVSHGAD